MTNNMHFLPKQKYYSSVNCKIKPPAPENKLQAGGYSG